MMYLQRRWRGLILAERERQYAVTVAAGSFDACLAALRLLTRVDVGRCRCCAHDAPHMHQVAASPATAYPPPKVEP